MLNQDTALALLAVADEVGATLTLVGDRAQLSAVGRGCARHGRVTRGAHVRHDDRAPLHQSRLRGPQGEDAPGRASGATVRSTARPRPGGAARDTESSGRLRLGHSLHENGQDDHSGLRHEPSWPDRQRERCPDSWELCPEPRHLRLRRNPWSEADSRTVSILPRLAPRLDSRPSVRTFGRTGTFVPGAVVHIVANIAAGSCPTRPQPVTRAPILADASVPPYT